MPKQAARPKPVIAEPAVVKNGGATLASEAYQRLREDIINAVLVPGSKLRVQELCTRYGMGQSPIREALNRLVRDGLASLSDHKGFSVTSLSRAHLESLTKTRCWVNEIALRESMLNGDSAWEEGVVLAYHRLTRNPRRASAQPGGVRVDGTYNSSGEQAHRAFHTSLISACGSPWLIDLCEQLFDAADRYRHLARATSSRTARPRGDEHKLLVDAVVARDVDRAVAVLKKHFSRTHELARGQLSDDPA